LQKQLPELSAFLFEIPVLNIAGIYHYLKNFQNDRIVISKRSEKSFKTTISKKEFSSLCSSKRVTRRVMTHRDDKSRYCIIWDYTNQLKRICLSCSKTLFQAYLPAVVFFVHFYQSRIFRFFMQQDNFCVVFFYGSHPPQTLIQGHRRIKYI